MSKYCCFFCPTKDYSEKALGDVCATCTRPYGFPLDEQPKVVNGYRIIRALDRGFYGAAYIAESGTFNARSVVKISPISFYDFFGKPNFEEETRLHNQLAQNATHVVGLKDAFSAMVEFSDDIGTKLECYVTVLDYVEGNMLRDYINGNVAISAAAVCQIAIDLISIRNEFEANELHHNDLHDANLIVQKFPAGAKRTDAIDDSLLVKAIDLGSISSGSKSTEERLSDVHFIALHIESLLDKLLSKPSHLEDKDYRIALALQSLVHGLQSRGQNVRLPNASDLIEKIRETYNFAARVWKPWTAPFSLKGYGDHYNAQTLESWHVPSLLVDPEDRWLAEVSKPGPQIITGMRGCGKTMLLRSLDFHARASQMKGESADDTISRIRDDRFLGLFVSASRLLDLRELSLYKVEYTLTRLFINYSLEAVRAILHLRDVDESIVSEQAHRLLSSAVADFLEDAEELRSILSLEDLERNLEKTLVKVLKGNQEYSIKHAPVEVFSNLANQLRKCSEIFGDSSVFFLLDDVSTRYLEIEKIERIISTFLFQSPTCAFKFTSEWQTIELGLKSPGRAHPIRIDRDLSLFDLGADVYQTISASGNRGKNFVSQVLQQRARFHTAYARLRSPKDLLGDVPLETIAREISSSTQTSITRKNVYRGLSCLTKFCIGDIGDVVKLYEDILRKFDADENYPISDQKQSASFQALSSRRLYELNRRDGHFKDNALAFAQAAHKLLVRSYRQKKKDGGKPRLRQYSLIYVRITTDDEKKATQQIDRLRELIDAGVFVFAGGAPRTKTKDSNPTQQFILSYRKVYGLAAYIGLADRDRFELSGDDLERWLENPSSAEEILLRNQASDDVDSKGQLIESVGEVIDEESYLESDQEPNLENTVLPLSNQAGLFEPARDDTEERATQEHKAKEIEVNIDQVNAKDLSQYPIESLLTGLGFEDRTLAANKLLSHSINPSDINCVRYSTEGYAKEVLKLWEGNKGQIREISYEDAILNLPDQEGLALIDISGLSKSLIFQAVRQELLSKGRVFICHGSAEFYYPLQEDLEKLFAAKRLNDPLVFLESLAGVLKGEVGPYEATRLLDEYSDPSRKRALLAFASAKHERLYSLLDRREYDYLAIVVPDEKTARGKVAVYSADFICQDYLEASTTQVDTNDLLSLVRHLDEQYLDLYRNAGANLELGLTGSKSQTVAAAILSVKRKISQAWYITPQVFDEKRFSKGVGEIRIFDISLSDN